MRVGQLSESDAVDALRLPFSSSRHARGSNRRAITLIWGIPDYINSYICQKQPDAVLGRKWVGIDISPKAVELVNMRLQQSMGSLFHHGYVTARTDIPRRTDIESPIPYRQNKHVLFGQQEGLCNGCKGDFPFKLFEVDHRVPRSRGGTDHLENLQLVCSSCNRIKGDRPHEYLVARLAEIGA